MRDILPVVFGYDIAAYSFARIFHEAAGLSSLVVAEGHRGPINHSSIIDVRIVDRACVEEEETFLGLLTDIAEEFPEKKLVLLVNTDEQVGFVSRNRELLSRHYFLPYGDDASVRIANSKERMAELISSLGFPIPARSCIDLSSPATWESDLSSLTFPVVVKPELASDLGRYWNKGLRKVLKISSLKEAMETFTVWRDNGVQSRLIVQDLIMGDDTAQWVVNGYVDSSGTITACGSGRVILGLHQPEYLGNAGIIFTEHNAELIAQAKKIVSAVGLRGFFSMDVKIDPRNHKAYWLDLNPRIGRGHYYLKVAGVDLASAMLADMRGESFSEATNNREGIFAIIPSFLANRSYVKDGELRARINRVRLHGGTVNPLIYQGDRSLRRRGYVIANGLKQVRRMRQIYPEATATGF